MSRPISDQNLFKHLGLSKRPNLQALLDVLKAKGYRYKLECYDVTGHWSTLIVVRPVGNNFGHGGKTPRVAIIGALHTLYRLDEI